MTQFRCAVLSAVKHDYVARGVATHPRFELVVVADDPDQPEWVHERNEEFAREFHIPYIQDVELAIEKYDTQVAVVSPEAERHCNLSIRAANKGLHIVQDKPMSNRMTECDRLVEAVEKNQIKFLMWNRNFLPALLHAREKIAAGAVGKLCAIHVDFYFSKDAGPPKGSRDPSDPPLNWLEHQIKAHVDGSDGGLGHDPMGELQVEGIYPLAYIRMLAGVEVTRVFGCATTHFHQLCLDNDVEDLATVTLEMEKGVLGSLCIGRIGAASHPDIGEIKIHIIGTSGALVVSEARPEIGVYYRDQSATEFRHRRLAIDNDYLLMENFVDAIDNNEDTIIDARSARNICAVVHSALDSARTGKVVEVY